MKRDLIQLMLMWGGGGSERGGWSFADNDMIGRSHMMRNVPSYLQFEYEIYNVHVVEVREY